MRQIDINNPFLHGYLTESIYMKQPASFHVSSASQLVCHPRNAIYGLKQARQTWYERLNFLLHKLGFNTSRADTSLLVRIISTSCMYILIYVDDIIILGNSDQHINQLVRTLYDNVSLKDLDKSITF